MDSEFLQQLASRLAEPLPSPMDQHDDSWPADARRAAVLILLYRCADRWYVPLTLRPAHLPDHAGQICLPGGAIEPGEESSQAALREFHEEMGAPNTEICLLGRLSTIYVRSSHFCVEPWVGATEHCPHWSPNPVEVEQLLEVPLDHLLDPAALKFHEQTPHFLWESHRIWGATCRILDELITRIHGIPRLRAE